MIGYSPNEVANELARLHRDARLRRLKAVRSATSRVQQERLSSFRKHFDREKQVVERAAQIQRARITLADISALEDELRLALSQMGAAHQNVLTFKADLTEQMLRQNESFKAHITMSNLRFEAAIELIRDFRNQQQILKSAPAEQRAVAFQRAKELLKQITAINERTKSRYAAMGPCHPFDSIHELTPTAPIDFRVSRIHVDANTADARSLARIEDERHLKRMEETEVLRRQQAQVAERRAERAIDTIQSRRVAAEVQTSLREAVVQDRQRKLQIAKQRNALPPRPKQSQIKRAFETALPELRAVRRDEQVRQAQRRLLQRSRMGSHSSIGSRSESPDDLLERFSNREDAAVIPSNLLQNIVNVIDDHDADERKEEDSRPAGTPPPVPPPNDALNFGDVGGGTGPGTEDSERKETEDIATKPATNSEPEGAAPSNIDAEERRSVAFNVAFDQTPQTRRKRRSPSPTSMSSPISHSSTNGSLHMAEQPPSPDTEQQPEPISPPVSVLSPESTPPDPEPVASAQDTSEVNHEPDPEQQPTPTQPSKISDDAQHPDSVVSSSRIDEIRRAVRFDGPGSASPSSASGHESDSENHRAESISLRSGHESDAARHSPEPKPILPPSLDMSSVDFDVANLLNGDTDLLPNVDLSLDDLAELDRRAEELLRSHIPTTPQLLALPRDPDQDPLDFHLDDDGDDYAIHMLGVDSEELAASFARTLDETLDFLRQSRREIDNLRSEIGHESHDPDPSALPAASIDDSVSRPASPQAHYEPEDQQRLVSAPSSVIELNESETDSHDTIREVESRADDSDTNGPDHQVDLNSSVISGDRTTTTDDDRSSSLQEQFRANVALIERIEQRRAEVQRRRQSGQRE